MSTGGEQDLKQRLDRALGVISAGPAPVGDAMRQGSALRARRWMTAAGGVAALMAVAVAVPVALQARPPLAPSSGRGYQTTTVNPPGPHAPAGLIAWGRLGGRHWSVTAERPGAAPQGRGNLCFAAMGSQVCGPVPAVHRPDPAGLTALPLASNTAVHYGPTAVYGPVAADVAYLRVRLAGGRVLTLRPARGYGARYAAFVADEATVTSITAYSHRAELGTMIPFRAKGVLYLGNWLRAGRTIGLPRATRVIGAGRTAGFDWSVTAYQGPWGRCLLSAQPGATRTYCLPGEAPLGTSIAGTSTGPVRVSYGTAAADVAHVVITMSDGTSTRVTAVSAGNQKYFALAHRAGIRAVRWTSYDRAGHVTGTGRLTARF